MNPFRGSEPLQGFFLNIGKSLCGLKNLTKKENELVWKGMM